jgi:hypothetical protein
MYRELNPKRIISTAQSLSKRISERFPDSGLSRVSQDLLAFAMESEGRLEKLRRPRWLIRLSVGAGLLAIGVIVMLAVLSIKVRSEVMGISDLVQGIEAAINDVIFLGIAIFFLLTIETRLKRRAALRTVHELRSIAHIVDMHQLTKDPEYILSPHKETASSPQRKMTRFELSRYLNYCSEMLSITSKLAALQVQYLDDPVVLNAVNDLEALSSGLSGKIWQKIIILDSISTLAKLDNKD